jgi:transposase-like protein
MVARDEAVRRRRSQELIAFPITELLDEQACYEFLLGLHPKGLRCPAGHKVRARQAPHMRDRAPVVDYRCRQCGKGFNLFTNILWKGTHYSCRQVVLLVRGFAQGGPTLQLARELQLDYETVRTRRHSWQEQARKKSPDAPARSGDRSGREVSECGRKRHVPARRGGQPAVSR